MKLEIQKERGFVTALLQFYGYGSAIREALVNAILAPVCENSCIFQYQLCIGAMHQAHMLNRAHSAF